MDGKNCNLENVHYFALFNHPYLYIVFTPTHYYCHNFQWKWFPQLHQLAPSGYYLGGYCTGLLSNSNSLDLVKCAWPLAPRAIPGQLMLMNGLWRKPSLTQRTHPLDRELDLACVRLCAASAPGSAWNWAHGSPLCVIPALAAMGCGDLMRGTSSYHLAAENIALLASTPATGSLSLTLRSNTRTSPYAGNGEASITTNHTNGAWIYVHSTSTGPRICRRRFADPCNNGEVPSPSLRRTWITKDAPLCRD